MKFERNLGALSTFNYEAHTVTSISVSNISLVDIPRQKMITLYNTVPLSIQTVDQEQPVYVAALNDSALSRMTNIPLSLCNVESSA